MANRDIAGLLTGISSRGVDPLATLTPDQQRIQMGAQAGQRMVGGVRGMLGGGPTAQEKIQAELLKRELSKTEGIGQINPQFYTPESIQAFNQNMRTTGIKDYSLLKEVDRVASTYKVEKTKDNLTKMGERSKAFQNSANLQLKTRQMRELLDSGLQTGALAKLSKGAKSFVQSLFPDTDISGLKEAEVFDALSNQLALLIRNPDSGMGLPGATSNRDLNFLIDSVPNLSKSVSGNKLLLEVYDKMYNLQADVMREQRRIIKGNNNVPPLDLEEQLASFVENSFKLDDEFKQKIQEEYSDYSDDSLDSILKEEGYLGSTDTEKPKNKKVGFNPRGF